MSFLSPSILWGLLAASIPIIIHLVSTRRTQKVNFSTIRFIKALEHDTIRKLKLRQWLLLFLRSLAVALLALVFARPVKVGYFPAWAAGDKTTQMILLMDNSASMGARFDEASLLERSKQTLLQILENVEGKVSIDIYQTTPHIKRYSGDFTSRDQIKHALSLIRETSGEDSLWGSITNVLRETEFETGGTLRAANREFYIFSDFPVSIPENWNPSSLDTGETVHAWRYYLFPQPEIENNLSVASIEVLSQLRLLDHLVSVAAQVTNQTEDSRRNVPVQLYFDEDRVGQVVSDFPSSSSKHFLFRAFPNHTGFVRGAVEIPPDNYAYDNRRFAQFAIPPNIHCKVVGSSQEHLSVLALALSSINQDSLFVVYERFPTFSAGALSLEDSDILILVDPGNLRPSALNEIRRFTRRGGRIIAFLGERYSKGDNLSFVDLPLPEKVIMLDNEAFHAVTTVEKNHPLFLDFPAADLLKEMPQVFGHVKVVDDDQSKVLLTLSNGDPLLMEAGRPSARTLIFATLPDLRWTDLPLRGLFVPLLHRMLVYLAADEGLPNAVEVGETVVIPLRRELMSTELQMINPSGARTLLVPDYREEQVSVSDVNEAGVYRLLSNGREVASFVANISPSENPFHRLPEGKLSQVFPRGRSRIVGWDEEAAASVMEARRGTELWRLFLAAALVVLVIETWVGRVRKEKPE